MNWYVRKGGSDSNGGSSTSLTPERSGTDMTVTDGSTAASSATGSFTSADIGKAINIQGYDGTKHVIYKIAAVTDSTHITLDRTFYGASTSTNRQWAIGGALATISKLLVTNATIQQLAMPIAGGDQIVIGAGVYREILAPSYSNTSMVTFVGDSDGTLTGDMGEVQVTAYLTDDKTAPSSSTLLGFSARNYWGFSNITFVPGTGNPRMMLVGNATNLTFTNCTFLSIGTGNLTVFSIAATTASARNILFDKCRVFANGGFLSITLPTVSGADYDANIVVKNCVIFSMGTALDITASGALANKGGGVYFYNNTLFASGSPAIRTASANNSLTYPVKIENNVIICSSSSSALSATTSGQITEQYNMIYSATPRTNITTGTGSSTTYAPLIQAGQEQMIGGTLRPFGMPTAGSPISGFGNSTTTGVPTDDILGAGRPTSTLAAIGAYERGNGWGKETGTVRTGSNAISITGPGYQDFLVPVDATSTTVTVYVRWDATYAGTKPSMSVLNGTEIGVSTATATAAGSSGSWEQLSLNFTPTVKGLVTIRLISSDTNGGGKTFADDWAVT